MELVIEDASIRDLDRLYEIESECFLEEAFSKAQIAQLLKDYNSISLVARVVEDIVGFLISTVYADRKALHGHVLTIEVLPTHRRSGVGKALLDEVENIFRQKGVKSLTLEVREDNVAAIGLYRKLGYEVVGQLKNYYGSAHGIYLRKALT
jgi:ribosomal-protein-alanine N-acetyltransferase